MADAAQAKNAIAAAKAAFPAWSTGGIQDRANILDKVGSDILARKDEIGRLLAREEGKTLPEGVGETVRAGHIFKFFAGEVLRLAGEKLPSVRPGVDVEVTREPIGVIGLITPWNFPIAIPAWKIAPALAFGNTVVFKPAQWTPGCAWVLTDILASAGIPKGVFNLVMGSGSVVGDTLRDPPRRRGDQLHRLDGDGQVHRAEGGGAHGQVPAGDGEQEPARGAGRRRRGDRGERGGAGRVFLDRAALHRVVAPHRHRGYPRSVRRRADRPSRNPQGRRRAGIGHGDGPGRRGSAAADGPRVHRRRSARRREARLRRRAPEARHRGLLPRADAVHRAPPMPCGFREKRSSDPSPA